MTRLRGAGKYGRPKYNQAQKIIAKFGGEVRFAEAVGVARIRPYVWQYARPYGTDGLIPSRSAEAVKRAARLHGVLLTPADWEPEVIDYEAEAE